MGTTECDGGLLTFVLLSPLTVTHPVADSEIAWGHRRLKTIKFMRSPLVAILGKRCKDRYSIGHVPEVDRQLW